MLSAGATQPSGGLDGKIVYLHGGHGYTASNLSTGGWATQRPLTLGMVEDMGNQDQMTFLADYLWNAGATVAALRPIGHQPNEVVMDNDDPGVTFSGAWSNSSSSIYFGSPGDVPYRFATTSLTETAAARYTPNIPEAGFYPVYSWTRYGSDRATDHLYKVGHAGGVTEVTVNHRRVGNGTVYLGTFYFEQGASGYVEISNRSAAAGDVVIADMIRFGNGRGDINRGGGVSGFDREDESGLYWVQWHVDRSQGVPDTEYRFLGDDFDASISFSPRYAEYMNREADGGLEDRLFVSFHSNAGGGRGVIALHNTANGGATPNQLFLAQTLAREVNDDLVAQNGQFEHNWRDRGNNLTFQNTFNYGEINNSSIRGEFDATIVETGFHDDTLDAQMLRDPKVRDAIAEATYQGIVNYFRVVDNNTTPATVLPDPVTGVRARPTASGEVLVEWEPPVATSYGGDAPTSYTVFASTNGYGFDSGREVSALASSLTVTGLDPNETYYFRVAANNQGGRSRDSEVVAATAGAGARVLIVNGFDRLDRNLNPEQTFNFGGQLERVRPRQSNSFDYAVQMAGAISAAAPDASIATTSNEALEAGDVLLADYDSVFWILGEESSDDQTFSPIEQQLVTSYLAGGGNVFASGAEIGWDLDFLGNGRSFYNNQLRANFISDDANTYRVQGAGGSIFEGLSFSFDDGSQFYDAEFPDIIVPRGGATTALTYPGGTGAGITFAEGSERLVMLAFPFETITSEASRIAVMERVLGFFDTESGGLIPITIDTVLDNDQGAPTYTNDGGWLTSSGPGYNGGSYDFSLIGGSIGVAEWRTELPLAGTVSVYTQYVDTPNRATGALFTVESGATSVQATVDQSTDGLQWTPVATLDAEAGPITVRLDATASTGPLFSSAVADAVRIVFRATVLPSADFNADGTVNAADFTVWRDNLGQSVPLGQQGDADFDGQVTIADYEVFREQFGGPPPSLPESEPVSAALAAIAAATAAPPRGGGAEAVPPVLPPLLVEQRAARPSYAPGGPDQQAVQPAARELELLFELAGADNDDRSQEAGVSDGFATVKPEAPSDADNAEALDALFAQGTFGPWAALL